MRPPPPSFPLAARPPLWHPVAHETPPSRDRPPGVGSPRAAGRRLRPDLIPMRLQRYLDCARLNGRVIRLLTRNRWVRPAHVAQSYDRLAPDYDQAWLLHLQDTTRRLLDGLPAALPDGPFLDLGCGTGFAALHLAARHPGRAILACDFSPGMIAEARTRPGADAIEWHVADMLAFLAARPAASAALAVAAWSAGYTDFRRVCRESRRILVPGGRFAFVVNLADTLAPLRRAFRYCMQAHAADLRCLARFPFP
ncbi:MAG: methyltransferase domain-containing protein, partial [Opitutae bacterium]|nr:methyltransferase domain-containing protein [Opitutae bacterium]